MPTTAKLTMKEMRTDVDCQQRNLNWMSILTRDCYQCRQKKIVKNINKGNKRLDFNRSYKTLRTTRGYKGSFKPWKHPFSYDCTAVFNVKRHARTKKSSCSKSSSIYSTVSIYCNVDSALALRSCVSLMNKSTKIQYGRLGPVFISFLFVQRAA